MRCLRPAAVAVLALLASAPRPDAQGLPFALFERYLESLREQTGIPGISSVIVQGGRVVWAAGLGKQDVDRSVDARDDTVYPIGDLTQTLAAVLVGRCVQNTGLDVYQPVRRWTDAIPESGATVRHVMSHASSGVPGETFHYDAGRYAAAHQRGRPVPGPALQARRHRGDLRTPRHGRLGAGARLANSSRRSLFSDRQLSRFDAALQRLATPYRVDRAGKATKSEYPNEDVNAATGLVSTAQDLARLDAALGDGSLVRRDLLSLAWNNVTTSSGAPLPSGIGWFVQTYNGDRLVWHFGVTSGAASSLMIKVPTPRPDAHPAGQQRRVEPVVDRRGRRDRVALRQALSATLRRVRRATRLLP